MTAAALLMITALIVDPQVLVLRSGVQIEVQSPPREEHGRLLFRSSDGALYSIEKRELDEEATRVRNEKKAPPGPHAAARPEEPLKLKVDDARRRQLIEELERNHSGEPATRQPSLERMPLGPRPDEVAREKEDEWSWRNRAHVQEEAVRQAKENRDLLVSRAEQLRSHISGLVALGYRPSQFTYDSGQLQYYIEQIPYADLEVTRAERAQAQFLEDARRQGILPGWLR
jgi:hypothetical protein